MTPYYKDEAISSPEALHFVRWLRRRGFNMPWHAYDARIRAQYANEVGAPASSMEEIQRVMEDPWFGVAT